MTTQQIHLSVEDRVKLGSHYTPIKLVDNVYKLITPFILKNYDNTIIFDNAAGFGAFIIDRDIPDYRVADCDTVAHDFLILNLDPEKVFFTNSLINVSREKFKINNNSFLIAVGNPPYNDITSEFKSGKKGQNICDTDLFDRDLGVSFLKSYVKLKPDVVCVLHPLSYLIKETNFKRLKEFKDNYRLENGIIFSSSWFSQTGSMKFPILIALYLRNALGMDFEYIKNFNFSILDNVNKFTLNKFSTSDGIINKYPPRKNDCKFSPINLYFYTFRDFNSLRKNASFLNKPHYNALIVTIENFYKYAYLYSLKKLFLPENIWLYGNISPLCDIRNLEINKKFFVEYAIQSCSVLKSLNSDIIDSLFDYYNINSNQDIHFLEKQISHSFKNYVTPN